jgi:sortase (surface protein transpeptidase)
VRKKKQASNYNFRSNIILNLNFRSYAPLILMVAGLSGLIYFADQSISVRALEAPPISSNVTIEKEPTAKKVYSMERSVPVKLSIPKLGIETKVSQVGQNPDKSLEVPGLFEHTAGWYKLGPTPGEIGPAVIVGHVDNYKGPSVFYNLYKLKPGDKFSVFRSDKKTAEFEVISLAQYPQNKFPTKKVYGDLDYAGLRLITCSGVFNKQTGRYSDNTVVYAKLIEP